MNKHEKILFAAVYAFGVVVVLLDLLVWRPN
jgi:hypothetical protein